MFRIAQLVIGIFVCVFSDPRPSRWRSQWLLQSFRHTSKNRRPPFSITGVDGSRLEGRVAALTDRSLTLLVNDSATGDIRLADVGQIVIRDSRKNGALIGLAAGRRPPGTALGFLYVEILCERRRARAVRTVPSSSEPSSAVWVRPSGEPSTDSSAGTIRVKPEAGRPGECVTHRPYGSEGNVRVDSVLKVKTGTDVILTTATQSIEISEQLVRPLGAAEFFQSPCLDLPNALARKIQGFTQSGQRLGPVAGETEASFDDELLFVIKLVQQLS